MLYRLLLLLLFVVLVSAGALAQGAQTLTVVAHDSFNYSEEVLEQFTTDTGIEVEVLRLGDTGTMVNQLVLSRANPLGDVVFGIDNTFLGRAANAELFVPYESPALETVPDEFLVEDGIVTPIDYGDVCLNYDVAYFEENDLSVPETLADLTEPEYAGLLVVQNPATSSPGLAFLLATIGAFGSESEYDYLDFWADLVENDVLVVDDWTTAYYGEFSGSTGSEGTRPLVVSYASSPPVEVYFMDTPPEFAPTAAIVADNTCFRQVEYAGILQGTDNLDAAQQFIDFLLSLEFQQDMPLNMFVFPVNQNAALPEVFVEYAAVAEQPVTMSPAEIDENRETWLQAWTETVLR